MSNTNKDYPAFPSNLIDGTLNIQGMTLRDYFAAKAMQAYLSDSDCRQDMTPEDTAFAAYELADAMLRAREQ